MTDVMIDIEREQQLLEPPARDVLQAVQRITRDLPALGKGGYNKEQGYDFRQVEAITAALQPLLARHGVNIRTRVLERTVESFTTKTGTVWTDTTVKVEYVFHGPGGGEDYIVYGPIYGLGRDNSSFGTVKAMRQAFKILCNDAFCVSDRTDVDEGKAPERDAPAPEELTVSEATAETTYVNAAKKGVSREDLDGLARQYVGVGTLVEVPKAQWSVLRDAYAQHLKDRDAAAGVLPGEGEPVPADDVGPSEASNEADTSQGSPPRLGSRVRKES